MSDRSFFLKFSSDRFLAAFLSSICSISVRRTALDSPKEAIFLKK
jgi:hypothetical protein